jgi:(p)ppGpp synthase/HD superfamily hydrolase
MPTGSVAPGLLLKRALDFASEAHRDQLRKYPNVKVPYVSHVAGVVAILARHGFDEEVQAAGALHDVMEDCNVSFQELERRFGGRVAALVRDCSEEDKNLSWEARKAAYIERFPKKPLDAQAVTLADKIDNFLSIEVSSHDHGDPWSMFKRGRAEQLARFDALDAATGALAATHAALVDEFRQVLERVRALPSQEER